MAGVKGRSGGARPNTGGARPGAGRKPKAPATTPAPAPQKPATDEKASAITRDPVEFLLDVMQGLVDANATQVRAAVAAAQYKAVKMHDGGKKDAAADAATKASTGKFGGSKPPPLKVVGSR